MQSVKTMYSVKNNVLQSVAQSCTLASHKALTCADGLLEGATSFFCGAGPVVPGAAGACCNTNAIVT